VDRYEAIETIKALLGKDLVPLAHQYGVTIWKSPGRKNKGWAGHVIERYLGLPPSSAQRPNFGSWELKVVPVKRTTKGLVVKETMAVTMIDPGDVALHPFEESHLLAKLQCMVVAARMFENVAETASALYCVGFFDLSDYYLYEIVKNDYELARSAIRRMGLQGLKSEMGQYVQPRTKGPGHGSQTRAFYARKPLVAHMLGLQRITE